MQTLDSQQLVNLWEHTEDKLPWQKAMAVLMAVFPQHDYEQIAAWPLGYRDRCLYLAHAQQFGPMIEVQGNCAHCASKIDLKFHTDAILADDSNENHSRYSLIEEKGYQIQLRSPTTEDLQAVASHQHPGLALQEKLIGEVLDADNLPISLSPEELATFRHVIEPHIQKVQPLSEVVINAHCPECGEDTPHLFDILEHFWCRIAAEGQRLLWDVHLLARAYGWSGKEILELSPVRRRQHIAMVMG